MNAIIKGLPLLATIARGTISASRSLLLRKGRKPAIQTKNYNEILFAKVHVPSIKCRFYGTSDSAHQRRVIIEWNAIGEELSSQKRWSEALEAFNKVLAVDTTNFRALTGKAVASYMLKNFQVAIDCYKLMLDRADQLAPIYLGRGIARCELGQYDEALEDFKKVLKLDGEEASKHFWEQLGADIDHFGPKSAEIYRRALKGFSNEPILYCLLANCLITSRQFNEALEPSKRAVEMDPNNVTYLLTLGRIEFGLKNWKQALQLIDKCIELGTANNDEYVWTYKTEAEYHLGNYDEMEKAYHRAFEHIKPSKEMLQNVLALASLLHRKYNETDRAIKLLEKVVSIENYEYSTAAQHLANILIESQRVDDVVKLYRKLHETNPSNVDVKFLYAVSIEPEEGVRLLEELARTTPEEERVWRALSSVYERLEQYENCLYACNKAIAIEDSLECRQSQVFCYVHLRQYDKENEVMHRVYEMKAKEMPEQCQHLKALLFNISIGKRCKSSMTLLRNTRVSLTLGTCEQLLKEMGREAEALESIERAVKLEPHWACYCQKMDILGSFGRFDEAFEAAKHIEALIPNEQMNPPRVIYHLTVGVTLQKQGKYEEALKHINVSIENMDVMTEPDIFRFQYWTEKAKVLEALHRDDEAITNYEHALHIFPHEPHSLVQLTKLYLTHGRESEARALAPRLSSLNTDVESCNKQVADLLARLK